MASDTTVTATPALKGLVLAGGRSRRMGRDKAHLRHGDDSQLAFAVRLLATFVPRVYVSTRAAQASDPERARFPQIVDRYDDMGPIAGVLSAMDSDPQAAWLVVACDLPNLTAATLETLLAARDPARPFTAFKSSVNDLPEPLCAVYEPGARPLLDEFVAAGIACPRKMMIRSDTLLLAQPDPRALHNVNTPADLENSALEAAP